MQPEKYEHNVAKTPKIASTKNHLVLRLRQVHASVQWTLVGYIREAQPVVCCRGVSVGAVVHVTLFAPLDTAFCVVHATRWCLAFMQITRSGGDVRVAVGYHSVTTLDLQTESMPYLFI